MYGIMADQYLAYCKRHPEESDKPGDIYDHFYSFLELLGMEKSEAEKEVAYFMNAVCNHMD